MDGIKQEQNAQMNPDEMAQMQQQQCIFCHIVSGKIPSRKVFEDEKCICILDINPANPGHVLIIPKEHHPIMPMMPEEEITHMFRVAKKVSMALIRGLQVDGTNIFIANGAAAGQKAPHFMIHVIPRKENDGLACFNLPKNEINEEDQEKLKKAVKAKIEAHLGQSAKEDPAPPKQEPEPAEEKQEEQITEPDEERSEEDSEEIVIPPPEHFEGQEDEELESEGPPKKGVDLDKISKLFG